MTINGLWDYVNTNQRRCKVTVPVESFRGYRVAIDVMGVFFRLRMRVRTSLAKKADVIAEPLSEDLVDVAWYKEVTRFVSELLFYGITPLLVFEQGTPRLKVAKRKEREEERDKTQRMIDALRRELQINPYNVTQLTKLRKLEGTLKYVGGGSRNRLFEYLSKTGIPCLMGNDGVEAERLASSLVRYGVAAAAYSPDGDCLAHGCPILIRGKGVSVFSNNMETATFDVILIDRLLRDMEMDIETFREVCIMSGCDYNTNMYGIAFGTSCDLISKYRRIENVPESILRKKSGEKYKGISCLIHVKCREEFGDVHPLELTSKGVSLEEMIENGSFDATQLDINATMVNYGTERYTEDIVRGIFRLPKPREFEHGTEETIQLRGGTLIVRTGTQLEGVIN